MKKKTDFCICENKGADQLRGYLKAGLSVSLFSLYRQYSPSYPLTRTSKPLASSSGCTTRIVSDLVGHTEDECTHDAALIAPVMTD